MRKKPLQMKMMFSRRAVQFVLFFSIAMAISLAVTAAYVQSRIELERAQMEQIAMSRSSKTNDVLTKLMYKTQILSAMVVRSDGEVSDFEQIASTILDDPAIKNLILAPDGVVQYVYPIEGNEQVLGLNYFSEGAGNKEAVQAKETGQLVLGGPFDLIQGGQAMVGRQPIYMPDKSFWGIASVTLDYPQALNGAELEQLKAQGLAYEIWRMNPDTGERQIIANSQYDYNKTVRYVERPMDILNAKWYFRLSPIRAWYEFPETWVFFSAGLFISCLIGLLMMHNYDLNNMKERLEQISFTDPLTGALNRRGCFQQLLNLEESAPFLLYYLDLDGFKNINDQYGHHAGDFYLQKFAETIQKNMDKERHIFARVGGDEFILIFKNTKDIESMNAWFLRLKEHLCAVPAVWNDQPIQLAFSMGCASYPLDGKSLDVLLAVADKRMYECKNTMKKKNK